MPVPIVVLTALSLALSLAMGGYATIKPSLFVVAVSGAGLCLFLFCLKREVRESIQIRMLTIAATMPLLAWSLPSLGLLFIILCFWVPVAAGRFSLIVPVYLFSLLLLPGLDDELAIGGLKLFRFNVYNALAVGAAVAIFLNPGKAKCRIEWDIAAFSVVILLAMADARDTSISHHARALVKTMLDLGLPYYIVSRGLRNGNELRSAMLWLAAGGVAIAAILLFELWKGWPIYNSLYWVYELPTLVLVKLRAGMLRAGGPFVEPTSAAMMLAVCILALYLVRDQFRGRQYYCIALCAAIAGLIAPQSRGAWIGLFFAIAIVDVLRGRYAGLAVKISAVGGVISGMLLAAHLSRFASELLGLSGGSADTTDYRKLLFDRGLEEFAKNPLRGYSTAELQVRLSDLVQGEGIIDYVNTYIWIMLISGIGGLVIFVGAYLFFLSRVAAVGKFRGKGNHDAAAGMFVFAAIAMSMEMFFFTSFGTRPAIYLFALFGFAAAFIRSQRPAKRTSRQAGTIDQMDRAVPLSG